MSVFWVQTAGSWGKNQKQSDIFYIFWYIQCYSKQKEKKKCCSVNWFFRGTTCLMFFNSICGGERKARPEPFTSNEACYLMKYH